MPTCSPGAHGPWPPQCAAFVIQPSPDAPPPSGVVSARRLRQPARACRPSAARPTSSRYNGNILGNAMSIGSEDDDLLLGRQGPVGLPFVNVAPARARRHTRATMASAEFTNKSAEKRPTGRSAILYRKLQRHAGVMATTLVAIQLHVAAGLTPPPRSGDKGGVGIELDLDLVPPGKQQTAYEMMLSESRAYADIRKPGREPEAEGGIPEVGPRLAVIGYTTIPAA